MDSQKGKGFSEEVIDRVVEMLEIKPSDQFVKSDGSVISVKEEIWQRLDSIKMIFDDPERFNDWVAPAKMRNLFKEQHKKISDALDVLRSLSGPNMESIEASKKPNLARRWLYEVTEINPTLSAGLIGYDVVAFDRNFSTAIESLEKIESYFSTLLARAEASVKGPGENKAENSYADNLLGSLCQLYKDMTGQMPDASVDDINGIVRGKLVPFLEGVLCYLPYPLKITPWALEIKIRRLKDHEIYGYLWEDAKG